MGGASDEYLVWSVFVKGYLVDGGIETVVMCAERIEYRPDYFVAFVIVKGFGCFDIGREMTGIMI